MHIATVELPPLVDAWEPALQPLLERARQGGVDAVVLPEMPFMRWLPEGERFDPELAERASDAHARGLERLGALLPDVAVLTSRARLRADGFVIEGVCLHQRRVTALHQKSHLPEEPGWHEQAWFVPGDGRFQAFDVGGVRVGFMICTELMFTEHARAYARQGVDVIVTPRATGPSVERWLTAARMAAMWSGCYVLSANRAGQPPFAGGGFIVTPDARVLAQTTSERPVIGVDVDRGWVARMRAEYPAYLAQPPVKAPNDGP